MADHTDHGSNSAAYDTPGLQTIKALDRAFTHFNVALFDGRLPDVHLTIHRKRRARGYFWAEQFRHRETGEVLDEIAISPDSMARTVPEVLSTLVHEMVHLRQQHEGKPSKSGHNKEWASMMDAVGLEPTSTGLPGGKRTGRNVTHMIVPGGPFDVACAALLDGDGLELPWSSQPQESGNKKKKDLSKVKHTCPSCAANAWGKHGINLICGTCNIPLMSDDILEAGSA